MSAPRDLLEKDAKQVGVNEDTVNIASAPLGPTEQCDSDIVTVCMQSM